jgi:hypothetical protein
MSDTPSPNDTPPNFFPPPVVPSAAAAPAADAPVPEAGAPKPTSKPASKRGLLIGALVAVVAIVGVVVWQSGDDSSGAKDGGGSEAPAGTDHLVRYLDGSLTVFDADGANPRDVALPEGFAPALAPRLGRWLVEDTPSSTVRAVDLTDGTVATVQLPEEGLFVNRVTLAASTGVVVYGNSIGGSVVLADFSEGTARTVGGSEEGYSQIGNRKGYGFYVAVDGSATVVVPLADPAAAWEVPGVVLDVDGADTLVREYIDRTDRVSHYTGTELQGTTAEFDQPILGGALTADGATLIDTGGGVIALDTKAGTHSSLGVLGMPVDAALAVGDDRLLAWGSEGTALVAIDGTIVVQSPAVKDADGVLAPATPVFGALGDTCVTLQPGERPRTEKARAALIDLATGDVLQKLDATPSWASADGCTLLAPASPQIVVIDGTLVDVGVDRVNVLSPDLTSAIAVTNPDPIEFSLIDIATGSATPLDTGVYSYAHF